MRFSLISLLLLTFSSFAFCREYGRINVIRSPSGPGCNHVRVETENGVHLETFTLAEFRAAPDVNDSPLLIQIKRRVRESGLSVSSQIEADLESVDFAFDRDLR